MYPTVNALMDLWRILTAREIRIVEHCAHDVRTFLRALTAAELFGPKTWRKLTGFVKLMPRGDLLPCRARYSEVSNDWQVGINRVFAQPESTDALWFALPDVVASVILTGRIPEIVGAFLIQGVGTLDTLKETRLRGEIAVDPRTQDFFRAVVEERARLKGRGTPDTERLRDALKVLANSTSYGINAEMRREDRYAPVHVRCHGLDGAFDCVVEHPEEPGPYCFPPLASLITAGARLMLALLEHQVEARGGTCAMEDTDSMAIVATKTGGLVPCPGGPARMSDGSAAIQALSWRDVEEIAEQFAALNPYDRRAVRGSILKIEDDNKNLDGSRRRLWCFAISAKRYALFERQADGTPVLLRKGKNSRENRWSEHGLGHLLNPLDPESDDRDWIAQIWQSMISRACGIRTPSLRFADAPAVGRTTVTSPVLLKPFAVMNRRKRYSETIKPFSFLVNCHIAPFGHPVGIDPRRFHLIAPYERDGTRWADLDWIDQCSGRTYRIVTDTSASGRQVVRVKTYGSVLAEYECHPEAKCADADGNASGRAYVGLHFPRAVSIDEITHIGKESNELEEVEAGMVHSADALYTEYADQRRSRWATKIVPALQDNPLSTLVRLTGLSRRTLIDARTGKRQPHSRNRTRIERALRRVGLV
jgi:hypothetical protein